MALIDIANADLNNAIKADMELVNVQVDKDSAQVEVSVLKSDIGASLDPDTGQIVASQSITISFLKNELADNGLTLLSGVSIVSWSGNTYLLDNQMPDETLGLYKWSATRYDT